MKHLGPDPPKQIERCMLDHSCLGPCTGSESTVGRRARMPPIFGWLMCEKQCPTVAPNLLLTACITFSLGGEG